MFDRILLRFRSRVLSGEYVLSIHALEEMADDEVLTEDVEHVILNGRIIERQIDRVTRERKFVFFGEDLAGNPVGLVAKISLSGKVVVIKVYREDET